MHPQERPNERRRSERPLLTASQLTGTTAQRVHDILKNTHKDLSRSDLVKISNDVETGVEEAGIPLTRDSLEHNIPPKFPDWFPKVGLNQTIDQIIREVLGLENER